MSIREATPYDAEALAAVHASAFDRPWPASEIDALMLDGFGLVSEQAPAFLLARVAGDEAEILTVAVSPACRRRGWGRRLVDAAIEVARDQGARALFLEVATDNEAAVALYQGLGFKAVGRRPSYYARPGGARVDALVMRRGL